MMWPKGTIKLSKAIAVEGDRAVIDDETDC